MSPIKLKLGLQIGGRLLIATESNSLGNGQQVLGFAVPCTSLIVSMGRACLVRTRNSISGYLKPILWPKYSVQAIFELHVEMPLQC
jgi:hypothetical protein